MSRTYPELARTLQDYPVHKPPLSWFRKAWPYAVGGLLLGGCIFSSPWTVAGGLTLWLGASLIQGFSKARQRPGSREQVIERFRQTAATQRLNQDLDPVAAQILEACALHRRRILVATEASRFSQSGSAHWQRFGEQARRAADDGFERALLLSEAYLGRRGNKKRMKGGLEMALRDLLRGDLEDGLERLLGLEDEDDREERRQREDRDEKHVPAALRPAYQIAVKLKHLAGEVEATVRRDTESAAEESADSLDAALSELREIRQAEAELDQTQRLQS